MGGDFWCFPNYNLADLSYLEEQAAHETGWGGGEDAKQRWCEREHVPSQQHPPQRSAKGVDTKYRPTMVPVKLSCVADGASMGPCDTSQSERRRGMSKFMQRPWNLFTYVISVSVLGRLHWARLQFAILPSRTSVGRSSIFD